MPRLVQTDATTEAALAAAVSRLGWCEALSAALGDAYRVVWRTSGGDAVVTCVMTGSLPVVEQAVRASAQPASVTCASGTPTQTLLESADGTRWARLDRVVPLVDSHGAALAPVAGAGFTWVQPLVVMPPAGLSRLPAWLQDAPLLTWFEIPGTTMTAAGSGAGITSYSGGALRKTGSILYVNGGGHNDYYGNEVLALNLRVDAPAFQRIGEPTPVELRAPDVPYYSDGKPTSRHTYWAIQWVEAQQRLFLLGGNAAGPDNPLVAVYYVDAFDPETGEWETGVEHGWPNVPNNASGRGIGQDAAGRIWMTATGTDPMYVCDTATMAWTTLGTPTRGAEYGTPILFDPTREILFRPDTPYGPAGPVYQSVAGYSSGTPAVVDVTLSGDSTAISLVRGGTGSNNQGDYCPDRDSFLFSKIGDATFAIAEVKPSLESATWETTMLPIAGPPPNVAGVAGYGAGNGMYGRFCYVPELRGFIMVPHSTLNAFFIRTG